MRPSIRIASVAALSLALVAAGPALAQQRDHGRGSDAGAAYLSGTVAGLALGAAMTSRPVFTAPVAVAPAPVTFGPPAPVGHMPAIPGGYCYRGFDQAYVPCAPQPGVYYGTPATYGN